MLPCINVDVNHSVSLQAEQKVKQLRVSALKPTISCRLQLQRQTHQSEPVKCREQEVSSWSLWPALCAQEGA